MHPWHHHYIELFIPNNARLAAPLNCFSQQARQQRLVSTAWKGSVRQLGAKAVAECDVSFAAYRIWRQVQVEAEAAAAAAPRQRRQYAPRPSEADALLDSAAAVAG